MELLKNLSRESLELMLVAACFGFVCVSGVFIALVFAVFKSEVPVKEKPAKNYPNVVGAMLQFDEHEEAISN